MPAPHRACSGAGNIKTWLGIWLAVFVLCSIFYLPCYAANDFVLSPAKVELSLDRGERVVQNLFITNRLGRPALFQVELADVQGSLDGQQAVILLEEQKGLYSLKDFLTPAVAEFALEHNQTFSLPVEISLPQALGPGGLYGAVIVSALPQEPAAQPAEQASEIAFTGRIASLFFIKVKGQIEEKASLESFQFIKRSSAGKEALFFSILFRNQGNSHLNPYGVIVIRDIFSRKIDEIEVPPYFALPGALRQQEIPWPKPGLWGRYTASLYLNRGYSDIIDQKTISFWLVSWKIIAILGAIALLILLLISLSLYRRKK